MTTFINRTAPVQQTNYYRGNQYTQPPVVARPDVRDDYERWYTEIVPNNRMMLSLRSGIHTEVGWALDRLCRLAHNEKFLFSSIPGLIDALFDWPEWYATEGYKMVNDEALVFAVDPTEGRKRRYALESLSVLRNASLHEPNAVELLTHTHTFPLISNTLNNLDPAQDENAEALVHVIDIYQLLAPYQNLTAPYFANLNPIPALMRIASQTSNRSLIITSLSALSAAFSNPSNSPFLTSDSPALAAAIRYLPLFIDQPLIDACLNYFYNHISYPSMGRAFLLHPEMPAAVKILASLLVHEQSKAEEKVIVDVTGSIQTVPAIFSPMKDHELTKEELDSFLETPEPQRCYDWMKATFVSKADGELTQVDFWNLYKDTFTPFQDRFPLLVASDVIKNVTSVFPQAQAMVLQGPTPRFVVRGVDRRKDSLANERFRCHWGRSQCPDAPFNSPPELYDHALGHLSEAETPEISCLWSSCTQKPLSKHGLSAHLLTHISSTQPPPKHPSQSDTITLPLQYYPHPSSTPTERPPPPPRSTVVTYQRPIADPPSTALTALLILRILFRTSFASVETAPRADADHFGFPGVLEETDDLEDVADYGQGTDDREGARRGRRAFIGIRKFLEGAQLRDEILMCWINEMLDAGIVDPIPS